MKRGWMLVLCALLVEVAVAGCLPIAPQPGTAPPSPMQVAQDAYMTTGGALEFAREILGSWHEQGRLSDEEEAGCALAWAEAQAAMKAWKRLLADAEASGGALPATHPAFMREAQLALERLRALLAAAAAQPRASPAPAPATPEACGRAAGT